MRQLSTNVIESLLIATSTTIKDTGGQVAMKHLDRILRRHDRKGELRASILGMSPVEFKTESKQRSFDEIIKMHGFKARRDFLQALIGKLRDELLHRGWSRKRIDGCVGNKLAFAM